MQLVSSSEDARRIRCQGNMMRTKISSKGNISRELAASEFPETRLVRGVFAAISRQSEAALLWQLDRKRD